MRIHKLGQAFAVLLMVTASTAVLSSFVPSSGGAQVVAQTVDAKKGEADRLFAQGSEQAQTGQFTAALQSWQQALSIYREIKDRKKEGFTIGMIGAAYEGLGDYSKALTYYQQALSIAKEIKNPKLEALLQERLTALSKVEQNPRKAEADNLLEQGIKQFDTSQFTAGLQSWQQALSIYRELKDRLGEGNALGNLGIAYDALGDYPKAIDYHQQSLKIAREIKDRNGEGNALGNLGIAYFRLGDYPKAIGFHQQRLKIARELKNRLGEGNALGNLGNAYFRLGDYPKAIDYQQQSLKIAREIKDRNGEGQSLGNLGIVYHALGDYPKAIDYQQQRLKIAREIKDRNGEGQSLGNLGLAYFDLGDYPKAIDYQQQSLKIAREIKDRNGEGGALGNLGIAYFDLGDYPKAIDYLQQRLKIAREIKDRNGEGQSLGSLGIAYGALGDYPKAIDYLQQRLKIAREIKDRKGEGAALGNLGIAYYSLGDYPKAIDYLQQSLKIAREIKDRKGEGAALGNLGNAYFDLGDYPKAIGFHQQRLKIAREIKDRNGEGQLLNNLGFALYKQGNLKLAESTLFEGIKVYESLRGRGLKDNEKVSISDRQGSIYRTLQQVLIAQDKTDAALEIAERGRGRAFVELLAGKISPNSQQSPTPPTIAEIQKIAKTQNATLVQYSIIYDGFKVKGKQQYKQSELYIWVIKPTGEVIFRKSDLKPLWQKQNTDLEDLIRTTRNDSIGVGYRGPLGGESYIASNQSQPKYLQKLHKLLIEPIADLLPRIESDRVVFIPQDSLFLLPFPALQDKEGKYLIEKHTILTVPSIQVLDLTHQQRQRVSGNGALVVGNPTMPSFGKIGETPKQLPSLPYSETEVKAIAPLLDTTAIIGAAATKAAIAQKMVKAQIIHLATHGLLDDVKGLGVPGAIALAPSGQDDGLLRADEILDLKLNAELVVLSACDTGRGKITGDGVIGLSRSLISAGVPSVIVSLWSVPDNSTSELMTEFYKNLQQKQDKAMALRNAMLTTMKQHPSPKYWAAFTLIGEP
jgi:CHAT domain-containing protein/tetratricopeptide (TPR) repeat protein